MINLEQASFINLPVESLLSLALYLIIAAYVIFTAIFYYHWKNYSTDKKVTGLTLLLYLGTTLPLLAVMGIMSAII